MHSKYKYIKQTCDSDVLSWILSNTLDRSSIVKLCNACGINYPGMRTKSVSSDMLVSDLVKEFREQEATGDLILKALARVAADEISELHRIDDAKIVTWSRDSIDTSSEEFCRRLTAVVLDERAGSLESVPAMLDAAEKQMQTPTPGNASSESSPPSPPSDDLEIQIKKLQNKLQKATESADKQKNQNAHLENRVDRLRDKIKELQDEENSIRRESRNHQAVLAERDREISRLEDEQKKMPDLKAQLNRLERENRKLKYELEKQSKEQPGIDLNPVLQTFERNVFDIKGVVESAVNTIRSEHEDLRGTIDELQKEVHTLRMEAQKARSNATGRRQNKSPDMNRVGIFVDVQNMFYAARQYGARLDFEKLMQAAVGDRRLIHAIAYVIQTPEVDQTGFVAMLQQRSYQVKRKDLRLRSDGSAKGDWDMGMAIDMIGMADKLDVVVLVSGDGDFVSLITLLKEMGPRVEVFSFPHNTARDLMEVADRHYPIDDSLLIKMERPISSEPEREKIEVAQSDVIDNEP